MQCSEFMFKPLEVGIIFLEKVTDQFVCYFYILHESLYNHKGMDSNTQPILNVNRKRKQEHVYKLKVLS
jgi:hypothetical protein